MPVGKASIPPLATGMVVGLGFALLLLQASNTPLGVWSSFGNRMTAHNAHEGNIDVHTHAALEHAEGPSVSVSTHSLDEYVHAGEASVAQQLATEVRVLCWIMTTPENHAKKAIHVKNTWGKRCNRLLFISSKADVTLGAIGVEHVEEGTDWLWAKTKEAFKYVWKHHRHEADWFMKADDDTYVIVENLRLMLRTWDPKSPIYFGCRFKPFVQQGYMSGGAGYVLSTEALRRFVEQALPAKDKCNPSHSGAEDVELGKCLAAVGVEAGDSRDSLGRYRFLPFAPEHHIIPGHVDESFWYWKYIYYPQGQGIECCSNNAISFHYIPPNQMHVMEYLLYHLRPFGISHLSNSDGTQ